MQIKIKLPVSEKRAEILKNLSKKPVFNRLIPLLQRTKKRLGHNYVVYISEKHKAIYFPIPKVASTSLRESFGEMGFKKIFLKNIKNLDNYFKFTFVRNPLSRLKSVWRDKIEYPSERDVIAEAPALLYEDMPFEEFLKVVVEIPKKRKDKHFRDQYWFITDKNGDLLVDYIGKFENLQEEYEKICEKVGINNPPELPHKRKSKRKKDYRDYYDEETKKLVQERYKKDFELFGYNY